MGESFKLQSGEVVDFLYLGKKFLKDVMECVNLRIQKPIIWSHS